MTEQRWSKEAEFARSILNDSTDAQKIEALAAENAALREKLADREWRPIETAPKDGTWFLGWRLSKCEEYRVDVWAWNGFDRENMFVDAADSICVDRQPTHWMPLPKPPALTGGDNAEG